MPSDDGGPGGGRSSRREWLAQALSAALVAPWAAGRARAAAPPAVAVLVSHDAPPYLQALAGLEQGLRQARDGVALSVHQLDGDASRGAQFLAETRRANPRVVVTLGSLATRAAAGAGLDIPVAAGLVATAAELRAGRVTTGVVLEVPVATQLDLVRRILPSVRILGVLYNPSENEERVHAAIPVAARLGLAIEGQPVRTARELPAALDSLGRRVDALWGLPDAVTLTGESAKAILLFSFRTRIPLVGPSATWARAGAIGALDWDYGDLGLQLSELVVRLLQDAGVGVLPFATPRKVLYVLNQRTASHMKVEWPESVLRAAREVY